MRAFAGRGRLFHLSREGAFAVESLVKGHAEAVLIGAGVGWAADPLLGRHICGRSKHRTGAGQRNVERTPAGYMYRAGRLWRQDRRKRNIALPRPSEAEINLPRAPVFAKQDIVRLEVAVQGAGRVSRRQTAARL